MELTLSAFLIVCPAMFLAGVIDAVSGGGGLLTLPAFLLAGVPPHLISGTNIASCAMGAVVSAGRFFRSGKVYLRTALIACPATILGAYLGARLNLFIPEQVLEIVIMVLIPLVAAVVLFKRNLGEENHVEELSLRRQTVTALLIGSVLGVYNGFIGAGAGTFLMLAFAGFNKLDLVTANGNAKICGICATVAAAVTYAMSGAVLWPLALASVGFNVLGNFLGAGLALKKGARIIRPMFLVVLVLLFIRVGYSLLS